MSYRIADFKTLVDAIPQGWFRDVVIVSAMTGMRRGEILNLKWNAVDPDRHLIVIQSSEDFRTNRGKRRVIPMNRSVFAALQRRITARHSEYVFTDAGQRISREALSLRFKRKVPQLKLDDRLHFHSLRHYAELGMNVTPEPPGLFRVMCLSHTSRRFSVIHP